MGDPRKRILSDADIEALRETLVCHSCIFSDSQKITLKGVADNITLSNKIATRFIIYSIVATSIGGAFGGVIYAVKKFIIDVVSTGGGPTGG